MSYLKGWRYSLAIGGFIGAIALTLYPIVIDPMINTDKYRRIQERTRAGIRQEDIQPGNMVVWSDPFKRKND